ncbi:hypothetical protein C8R47DRAFT_1092705 [Mycena vitilis]|nr:hypothetical protein C8R47DRAFT_1092705 [Mycena vitilis]
MELPLELIESIIDALASGIAQDPWILDKSPDILTTLRACALAARGLVCRSQLHIFSGITLCGDDQIPPPRLSTVLTDSPHLASYVRALYFGSITLLKESMAASIAHILSSVTNLERLSIFPPTRQLIPGPVRDAFLPAFTLPHLRHLSLMDFYFEDVFELQDRLGGCPSLKSLMMHSINFVRDVDSTQHVKLSAYPPRIVLETLHLWYLDERLLQLILDTFTVVDIAHTRWLQLRAISIGSVLAVNAATVQCLEIDIEGGSVVLSLVCPSVLLISRGTDDNIVPANALANTHALQTLKLAIFSLPELNVLVRKLGHLGHLYNLRTVSVLVSLYPTEPAEWQELDALLDTAPALAEVNVYSGWQDIPDEPEPEFMPALAARGVLRIKGIRPALTSRIGDMEGLPPL